MLLGAAAMRPLMLDCHDDAGLAVVPVDGLDARHVAQLRAHAVAGDEKPRFQRAAIRKGEGCLIVVGDEAGGAEAMLDRDAEALAGTAQRADHREIRHHMRKRLAFGHFAVESQEDGAHGIAGARIGDDHAGDRLSLRRDLVPYAQDFKHLRGGRDDCRCSHVVLPYGFRRGFDDHDVEMRRCLLDCDRCGKTHIPATHYQHVQHSASLCLTVTSCSI